MSTHLPGFQSFSAFLRYFVLAKLASRSIRVKKTTYSNDWVAKEKLGPQGSQRRQNQLASSTENKHGCLFCSNGNVS